MRIRKPSFRNLIFYFLILNLTIKEARSLNHSVEASRTNSNQSTELIVTPLSAVDQATCKLPDKEDFMIVTNAITKEEIEIGAVVPKNTVLRFACMAGYNLKGFNFTVCGAAGRWTKSLPSCIPFCSSNHPKSGFSTKAYFELNSIDVSYAQEFELNTVAKISCADSFNKPLDFEHKLQCTENGWIPAKVPCELQCGQPSEPITQFSRGGFNAKITEVPWHVGIYREENGVHENICGGVLISPRVVVSAAHCFFESENTERMTNFTELVVAAGKYYRDFNNEKELNLSTVQIRKVIDIWIPAEYTRKKGYFFGDVAVLKLNQFIPFSEAIRPVCLFPSTKLSDTALTSLTGKLSTYSQTSFKEPYSVLKTLIMTSYSLEKCNEALPNELKNKLPDDKFCLASINAADATCKGDSGSGFVVKMPETNEFVLLGIVSFSPIRTHECTHQNLLVVTNVSFYQQKLEQFKREDLQNDVMGFDEQFSDVYKRRKRTCKITIKTENMIIKNFVTGEIVTQGFNAPMHTAYSITCASNYVLNGNNIAICRPNGRWLEHFPTCVAKGSESSQASVESSTLRPNATAENPDACRIPIFRLAFIVEDATNGDLIPLGSLVPLNKPVVFSCERGFILKGANNSICLGNDLWTRNLPKCIHYCSDKHPRSGFSTRATFHLADNQDVSQQSSFETDTLVNISCAPFYEKPTNFRNKLYCDIEGWSAPKIACNMKCGRPAQLQTLYSKGNFSINLPQAPWRVGIYKKIDESYKNICGGTIISPRIVVSAAQCFFQTQRTNFTKIDTRLLFVVPELYYGEYNGKNLDKLEVEKRNIVDIWTPEGYKGKITDYFRDISIIKLDRFMIFSETIQPACLYTPEDEILTRFSTECACDKTWPKKTHIDVANDQFCLIANEEVAEFIGNGSGSGLTLEMSDGTYGLKGIVSNLPPRTPECGNIGKYIYVLTSILPYKVTLQLAIDEDLRNDVDLNSVKEFN